MELQEEEYGANEEVIKLDRDILKSISGVENDLGLRYLSSAYFILQFLKYLFQVSDQQKNESVLLFVCL